jgi:hypothetical protein
MRRFVFIMLVLAIVVLVPIYYRPRPDGDIWTLESCTMLPPEDREDLGDARLVMRGPSVITTRDKNAGTCNISLGTKFMRDGGYVCEWEQGAKSCYTHFAIESETKR